MKLQDGIDFTTLNWVKQELDETLKQARQALEAYVEDPADSSLMRFCATYLHQVQGTLRMVELYGAAGSLVATQRDVAMERLLDKKKVGKKRLKLGLRRRLLPEAAKIIHGLETLVAVEARPEVPSGLTPDDA